MKKLLSIVLAVAMMATLLCVPAFAAPDGKTEGEYTGQTSQTDVNIQLNDDLIHMYSVDIIFPTQLLFTYNTGTGKWDSEKFAYVETDGVVGWTIPDNTITIDNYSDLPVNFSITSQDVVNTYGALSVGFGNPTGSLPACVPGGTKQTATSTVTLTGTPNAALTETVVKLGTVKVTITK